MNLQAQFDALNSHYANDKHVASVEPEEALLLGALAANCNGRTFIEVGRFRGHSLLGILSGMWNVKDGLLVSFDPRPVDDTTLERLIDEVYENQQDLNISLEIRLVSAPFNRTAISKNKRTSENVDFVFIDGDHRYEACLHDLELSWEILRPGGIIVVHDALCRLQPGVRRAVAEFREKHPGVIIPTKAGRDNPTTGDGFAIFTKERQEAP